MFDNIYTIYVYYTSHIYNFYDIVFNIIFLVIYIVYEYSWFSLQIFDRLRKENPAFELKIKPVEGDMMEPNLGISNDDEDHLRNRVNLVFHSAATIKFDEPLRLALFGTN